MTGTLESKLTLDGKLEPSTLSVDITPGSDVDMAKCSDHTGTLECEFGFVTADGLNFSISADDGELYISFYLKTTSSTHSVGGLPEDCLSTDNIPGFEKYLKNYGFSTELIMENTISVTLDKQQTGKFNRLGDLVSFLESLILYAGGTINQAEECGYDSDEYAELASSFEENNRILDTV